ncbi:hypothetical protein LCI18_003734 [Fusarium solani-melongenae]|uniref:Uncharacterized protein n=1 Tax=Fusarium solani subsp. cucurbitae TaxID=2747967 RepID=A0ACD3YV15_FUSSC|nr:hypothetical protein LCI18_003734 [Fusarium solani-melongenae]
MSHPTFAVHCPATAKALSFTARRRARKACIGCRKRKVRCDVTLRGAPCTNCQLDAIHCVVKERASRRQLPTNDGMREVFDAPYVTPAAEESEPGIVSCVSPPEPFYESNGVANVVSPPGGKPGHVALDKERGPLIHTGATSEYASSPDLVRRRSDAVIPTFDLDDRDTTTLAHQDMSGSASSTSDSMMIPYSSYPFLAPNSLVGLPSQDLEFLERKGTLSVPVKSMLDEFMMQYFLHVHPFLPLLDEGEFWIAYRQDGPSDLTKRIPLLLFRAMIFASSSFVPQALTRALGYSGIRAARSSFYHHTKLLYDLATEKSPRLIVQVALLLSSWSPSRPGPVPPNSMWLHVAIEHARFMEAHLAWEQSSTSATGKPHSRHEPRMLRRLWWCCLVRDRFLSLGLNRRIQITKSQPALCMSDFEYEITRSEVHTAETRRTLVHIFLGLARLCNILTDLLLVVRPSGDLLELQDQRTSTLIHCKTILQSWYDEIQIEISPANAGSRVRNHPVVVHTNLMYMVYHSSRSVLHRQEVLLSCHQPQVLALDSSSHLERSLEVRKAALGTVECLRELNQLDLARYLPVSALAFTAMPLFFHILDIRVLHSNKPPNDLEARHRRLQVLIDTMKECRPRYDGVEWVISVLRYAVNLAHFYSASISNQSVAGWTDLLTQEPSLCLRLTFTIDLTLRQTKIPKDQDFPDVLRGNLTPNMGLVRELSLGQPGANPILQISALQDSDSPLDTEPLRTPSFTEMTSPCRGGSPGPQNSQDVTFENSSDTEQDCLAEEDEEFLLRELLSSFPSSPTPSKDNQTSGTAGSVSSLPLTESLNPSTFCEYPANSVCDFERLLCSDLADFGRLLYSDLAHADMS